ncbi:hypothetical protein ACSBR2_036536 [Camellia fascicularis]
MSSAEDSHGQTTAETALVRMAEIEGRGRALVASKALRAGEVVLRDSPILLYSAIPLKPSSPSPSPSPSLSPSHRHQHRDYCSNCFRILDHSSPSVVSCPSCSCTAAAAAAAAVLGGEAGEYLFCGPNCRSAALASSHTPWVCQALSRLRDYCPSSLPLLHHHQERQLQARFLVAAYNLAIVSPSNFRILLCLQGESPAQPDDAALFLHSLIFSLCPPPAPHGSAEYGFSFSLELTAALLAKDKLNAFGLMEPSAKDGERSVRAYGIYPNASFFNHDCLPNACRFDYVDASATAIATASASECNTDLVVRVIHDIPQGREICLSYFPVNLNYSDRQRRLREDYGFTCTCDRCKVEANWSDDEGDEEEETEEAMDEDHDQLMEDSTEDGGVNEENNFPHAYFFLRYMCNRKNCWGTLAPLPPSNGIPSSVMECNVCGNMKNDDAPLEE